jgi:hypothetical protein
VHIYTELYYVGIQSVDRAKREMVVWVMRSYPGFPLPLTYSFFCKVLVEIFGGWGLGACDRSSYEYAGRENTSGITEKYIWHNSAAMFAKLHQTECVCIGINFSYGEEYAGPETLLPTTYLLWAYTEKWAHPLTYE